jgi:hypothetical protein
LWISTQSLRLAAIEFIDAKKENAIHCQFSMQILDFPLHLQKISLDMLAWIHFYPYRLVQITVAAFTTVLLLPKLIQNLC